MVAWFDLQEKTLEEVILATVIRYKERDVINGIITLRHIVKNSNVCNWSNVFKFIYLHSICLICVKEMYYA